MTTIKRVATGAAVAAALALAPTTAYASTPDSLPLPEAGDECSRAELGDRVELDDGTVLECVKDKHGKEWTDVTPDPDEEESEEDAEEAPGAEEETEEGTEEAEEEQGPDEEDQEETGDDGQDDEETAPNCIEVNTADAETLRMLRHVDQDRTAQIIALRPFDSFDDLDRVDGLRVGGPRLAELIRGGGEWLPLCEIEDEGEDQKPADDDEDAPADSSNGSLPVTGAALAALITTGVLALGGGTTAILLARRRHATH